MPKQYKKGGGDNDESISLLKRKLEQFNLEDIPGRDSAEQIQAQNAADSLEERGRKYQGNKGQPGFPDIYLNPNPSKKTKYGPPYPTSVEEYGRIEDRFVKATELTKEVEKEKIKELSDLLEKMNQLIEEENIEKLEIVFKQYNDILDSIPLIYLNDPNNPFEKFNEISDELIEIAGNVKKGGAEKTPEEIRKNFLKNLKEKKEKLKELIQATKPPKQEITAKDCNNSDLFYQNRSDGNCLFESISQIYSRDHISLDNKNEDIISYWAKSFRFFVSQAYYIASENEEFKKKYEFPNFITGIDDNDIPITTLKDYSKFIFKDKKWASDFDLKIIAKMLEIPIHIIQHDVADKEFTLSFDPLDGKSPEEDYYTFCNIDNVHWVLEKGGKRRSFIEDSLKIKEILKQTNLGNEWFSFVNFKQTPAPVKPEPVVEKTPEPVVKESKEERDKKAYELLDKYNPKLKKTGFYNIFSELTKKSNEKVNSDFPQLSPETTKEEKNKLAFEKLYKRNPELKGKDLLTIYSELLKDKVSVGKQAAPFNKVLSDLESDMNELLPKDSTFFNNTKNWIFTYLFAIFRQFPTALVMFGFITDAINGEFRYSIASLIGIFSTIANFIFGLILNVFIPFEKSGVSNDCSVPGFEYFDSFISPQGIVLPSSIFTYLFIDFGLNRSPSQNLGIALLFVIFFISHILVMVVGDCFKNYYGGTLSLLFALIIGFVCGLSGWIGVRVLAPDRFPSSMPSQKQVSPNMKKTLTTGAVKCSNPNNNNQITCE